MPDFDCVIRGGVVLVDGGLQSIDIGVIAGRIAALRAGLGAGVRTIDAAGRSCFPAASIPMRISSRACRAGL
jgi:dihydropyrimidinase